MSSLEGILEVILSCVSPENPKFHTRVVPDYKGNTLSPQTGKLLVRPTNQYPVKFESLSAALQNLHPRRCLSHLPCFVTHLQIRYSR